MINKLNMKKHSVNKLGYKMIIASLLMSFIFIISCGRKEIKQTESRVDLLNYVDPFIGTGLHGHTFPGPVMPHGMVQLSPDTKLNGWDSASGYHYEDSTIYGFSHTHLSGTGIGDMGDILLLPFTGTRPEKKPIATFDKKDEKAKVGSYAVKFNNYNVSAELATTKRVGIHQYTFEGEDEKRVLLDIGHLLQPTWGHSNVSNELEVVDNKTIRGLKHSKGWANDHKVYFYAEFSSPFIIDEVIADNEPILNSNSYKGKNIFAYLNFNELLANEALLIKVSISAVDTEGAKNNMQKELAHWDFKKVQQNTKDAWDKVLQKIKLTSTDEEKLKIFYTALYHSSIAPMTHQDIDGRYRGMDKKIHQARPNTTNYTVYSLWDTFRALHPLMSIIDEPKTAAWVNNLILKYKEGDILPRWALASNYTTTMVGYPAVSIIADALTKGISGIDKNMALESSVNSALYRPWIVENTNNPQKKRLMPLYNKYVNENKHIPADKIIKSVAFGLEMSYYDWCIAKIAKLNNNDSLVSVFENRAKNYSRYFNLETGFMRGKNEDGSWVSPFSPKYSNHKKSDYEEGNAWQWTWFVPHDVDGLIDLFGGQEIFTQKLDTLFSTSSEIEGDEASADISGLIGQYAHGNEPSHHIAYLYTYAGQPWKTQKLVDQILNEFYSTKPDGIIGNEDCGQMSAWYILNAMGFYQVAPGNPVYTIGRPVFDKVEIPLEKGKNFTIITENNNAENMYVQEFYLNDVKQKNLFFNHSDIKKGSTLKIVMGNNPKVN